MLKRLYIENFALVEKLEIEFENGMNVLTGETGAGKSIIVGALSRLLGEKAGKDDIRTGTRLSVVEADFLLDSAVDLNKLSSQLEIDFESNLVTLRREIPLNRASKSFINGQLVTLVQLKTLTSLLAELFGQHSHQQLLDENNHLGFLDDYAGLNDEITSISNIFNSWQSARTELRNLVKRKESAQKEHELLLFQKDEIEKSRIRVGEEAELLAEKKILDSSLILGEKSSSILEMIDRDEYSALNALNSATKEIGDMARLDKSLEKTAELLNSAVINLEEFRTELERYRSNIPDDPERLEQINLRLDELYRLKKKYGGSEEAILLSFDEINHQLETKIDVDQRIRILEIDIAKLFKEYSELAISLSKKRRQSAENLSKTVERELSRLGMKSAKFEFEFVYEDDIEGVMLDKRRVKPQAHGLENGRILISANPGEPVKPLVKTASGGEISRIMLALKSAGRANKNHNKTLLVFDEIDSGIGGQTANMVADRIADLADDFQLLVITHLHQIAAVGTTHFAVTKDSSKATKGRNVVTVKKLSNADRKVEINRMISLPDET